MSDTDLRPPAPPPSEPTDPSVDERDGYTMSSYRDFAANGWGGGTDAKGPMRFLGPLGLVAVLVALGYFGGVTMVVIVLALILSIVLHELGHFLTAKWAGMKATEFFIGFGPRIWSTTRGETEYGIKVIPAGAYVRIIGMSNLEEVDPADEDRTYRSKPYHKRLAVILAGPAMNIVLAFFLFVVVFAALGYPDTKQWSIDRISKGSAAEAAGLHPGDRVLSIGGQAITTFEDDLKPALENRAGQKADIVVLRADGSTETLSQVPLGWRFSAAGAAAVPGMQDKDTVLSTDNDTLVTKQSYQDFAAELAQPGPPLTYRFQRGAFVYEDTVTRPVQLPANGAAGFFGVGPSDDIPRVRDSVPGAVVHAGQTFGTIVTQSGASLGRLFSPSGIQQYAGTVADNVPGATAPTSTVKQLHPVEGAPAGATPTSTTSQDRPVSIIGAVRLSNDAAKTDVAAAVLMLAVINLSLGLLNLLPFLPLDGGHAAVASYEAIRSRPGRPYRVNMMKLMPVTYAFIAILLVFGLSSMFLDIRAPITP